MKKSKKLTSWIFPSILPKAIVQYLNHPFQQSMVWMWKRLSMVWMWKRLFGKRRSLEESFKSVSIRVFFKPVLLKTFLDDYDAATLSPIPLGSPVLQLQFPSFHSPPRISIKPSYLEEFVSQIYIRNILGNDFHSIFFYINELNFWSFSEKLTRKSSTKGQKMYYIYQKRVEIIFQTFF